MTIPGPPVPKGRPRVRVVRKKGAPPEAGFAQAYTPEKTRKYEDLIRLKAGDVMAGQRKLDGALRVEIRAYMQTPQAIAKHRIKGPSAEAGVIRPLTKPDVDNFAKVIDALNGIVWRDDSQVVSLLVEKFYSAQPRLVLRAMEL